MTHEEIETFLARHQTIRPGTEYYQVSILCSKSGQGEWHVDTMWVGYEDMERRIERRKPRRVDPEWYVKGWMMLQSPYLIVNDLEGMAVFLGFGGNALIDTKIGDSIIPDVLREDVCAPDGEAGFRSIEKLPKTVRNKAPSPKLRMEIIKRDGRKCRICGRQPEAHTDLELHVHHIRPWGIGGLTEPRNLITICSTCHRGLDPHFDSELYGYLSDFRADGPADYQDIVRYRKHLSGS